MGLRNRVSICWLKAYPAFVFPPPKTLQKIGGCVSGCTEIHTNTRSITQIHAEARIYTKNHAESRKVTQRTAFLGRFRGVLVYGRIGFAPAYGPHGITHPPARGAQPVQLHHAGLQISHLGRTRERFTPQTRRYLLHQGDVTPLRLVDVPNPHLDTSERLRGPLRAFVPMGMVPCGHHPHGRA